MTLSDRDDTKKKLIEAMKESMGIVTLSCKKVGVSRNAFYEWLKQDKEFEKAIKETKKVQIQMVEDRLLKAIAQDNITAIIFYLKSKHPEYKPKQQIEMPEGIDISIKMVEPNEKGSNSE